MQLKPHDTVVALKYGCIALSEQSTDKANGKISVRAVASSLGISPGEISKSNQRLVKAKLIAPVEESYQKNLPYNLVVTHMQDWLSHGIQYSVIAESMGVGRGMVTSWSNKAIHSEFVPRELAYVWLTPGGDTTGEGISPIYPKAPLAAREDHHLHYILSLIDAIRLGKPRELNIARGLIRDFMGLIRHAQ